MTLSNFISNFTFFNHKKYMWLAACIVPIIWLAIPCNLFMVLSINRIDTCDTEIYHDFIYPPSHRLLVLYTINLFKCTLHASNFSIAVWFNIATIFGLFYSVSNYFNNIYQIKINYWVILLCILCTPMILLTKINIQTDFYAGVLVFILITALEKHRKNFNPTHAKPLSVGVGLGLGALLVGAWHIKETAILPMFAYIMVVIYDDFKRIFILLNYFIWFVIATILFVLIECVFMKLEFNDFTHKFSHSWSLPHGNGTEYTAAVKSSALPLYIFHITEHLKIIGSQGISGILAVFGAVYFFKKHFVARFFIASLVLMCALGLGGNFTLARYWFLFYPADVALMYLLWQQSKSLPKYQYIRAGIVIAGVIVTALSYMYRYYALPF